MVSRSSGLRKVNPRSVRLAFVAELQQQKTYEKPGRAQAINRELLEVRHWLAELNAKWEEQVRRLAALYYSLPVPEQKSKGRNLFGLRPLLISLAASEEQRDRNVAVAHENSSQRRCKDLLESEYLQWSASWWQGWFYSRSCRSDS